MLVQSKFASASQRQNRQERQQRTRHAIRGASSGERRQHAPQTLAVQTDALREFGNVVDAARRTHEAKQRLQIVRLQQRTHRQRRLAVGGDRLWQRAAGQIARRRLQQRMQTVSRVNFDASIYLKTVLNPKPMDTELNTGSNNRSQTL